MIDIELFRVGESKVDFDKPYGCIQWKGTDVCIDIYCDCGACLHFDGGFMYFVQCDECKSIYRADQNIQLFKLNQEQINSLDGYYKIADGRD